MTTNIQVSAEQALQIALEAHLAGRHALAEEVYRKVLVVDPENAAALHYLGVLKFQQGQPEVALGYVERSIAASPLNAAYYNSCGEIYRAMGQLDEAELRIKIALRLKPDYVEALQNQAALYAQRGDMAAAEANLRKAVELEPDYAEGHNNLGAILEFMGKKEEALQAYERAVRLKPDFAEARINLARMLVSTGQIFDALSRYEEEFRAAIDTLAALLEKNPEDAQAHDRLGVALQAVGRYEEALNHHREAVRLSPNLPQMHINLGNALQRLERYDEAIDAYQEALRLNPDDAVAQVNLGNVLLTMGRIEDAANYFESALKQRPDLPEARYNLALVNLARGQYASAWRDYTLRHGEVHSVLVDKPAEPLPEDLRGMHILIVPDQGFGDELFFLRFAPELARRGAHLSYATNSKMHSLIARLPFLSQVVREASSVQADLKLSLGDLPFLVGMTRVDQIPPSLQLSIEPEAMDKVRNRLQKVLGADADKPLLGVTWRAGAERSDTGWRGKKRVLKKSIPSDLLGEALAAWPGEVLILQREPTQDEMDAFQDKLGKRAYDFSDLNDDLEQMLALLALLHDYVAVSNTNLHLRAALGKPTRVLIPLYAMDWRWPTQDGERSPWFADCPTYRQAPDGGWSSALARLGVDLAALPQ